MRDEEHRTDSHDDGHHADEAEAHGIKVVDLPVIAGTVVVADDGGAADGIAHEDGHKEEGRIHDDAVSRHAVLARKAEELVIVEDVDQRHGEVGHQLRRAVDAGIPQNAAMELRPAQVQAAGVVPVQEIERRQQAADDLAEEGRDRGTLNAPAEHPHQHNVQHHVGAARAHGESEAQVGLFSRNEKALEHVLQDKGRQADQQDAAIPQRIVQHLPLCAQQLRHRLNDDQTNGAEHDARCKGRTEEEAEKFVRLFSIALAQRDAHDGAAAGAQHKADAADEHGQRHDEVDRRKGSLAHEVRDAQAVHDAVDGGEQHGADAGQHEPDQPGTGKVIGQLDGVLWHKFSFDHFPQMTIAFHPKRHIIRFRMDFPPMTGIFLHRRKHRFSAAAWARLRASPCSKSRQHVSPFRTA